MAENEIIKNMVAAAHDTNSAEQGDLLDLLITGNPDAGGALGKLTHQVPPNLKRGKGRPQGAMNRQTMAMARMILNNHQHPLLVMAGVYSASPVEILRKIGIDDPKPEMIMDMFKFQMSMAEKVTPFVASRLPAAQEQASITPPLSIHIGGAVGPQIGQDGVLIRSHTRAATAQSGENGADFGGEMSAIDGVFKHLSDET